MKLVIFALVALISLVGAVDKEIFKTCEQSSFCRRCRAYRGPSQYEVLSDTLLVEGNRMSVDIRNNESQHLFVLKLGAVRGANVRDNIYHFEIDEKSPMRPRYRVTESLKDDPIYEEITVGKRNTHIEVFSLNSTLFSSAIIQLSPFQIDFYRNNLYQNQPLVSINSKDLMRFEHLRMRPESLDQEDDPESWEETFNGGVDSKPSGPEAVALDFTFPGSEVLFGIPEHADSFALKPTIKGEPYRLFNSDVFRFELDSPMALYGSVPVIYSHGSDYASVGVFWHNSADTFVDIHNKKTVHFMSEAGIIDVFIFLGPTVEDIFTQYVSITGVGNLPPIYSLGYHQSRWNYFTQEEVLEVVDNFDKHDLQLDTIWLDIEYTDDKKYFTWNKEAFPNPREMINNLNQTGRHLTIIIDPHTKANETYFFYSNNKAMGYLVKNKDGFDFEGDCWPGLSSYVDFFNPEAREYYADQYLLENFPDSSIETGIWNDMNEPSVFNIPEITMPRDNIHYGNWEHRNVHNQYGLMQSKGTFDGVVRRSNGHLRPFILTRAFFSGSQRYTAIWTGDNTAEWDYLKASIKMCLSLSVAGFSFCGSDVGGFFDDPEEELFVRWYQAGAFQPFFRAHSETTTTRREPYLLPESSMSIVREAIQKRYALVQFWYTIFYEHERFGTPVMRPMLMDYSTRSEAFEMDYQYMLSNKLLVHPVTDKGVNTVDVFLPETFYDFDDFRKVSSGPFSVNERKIPVFQRGGSIIPVKETIRTSTEYMANDPISMFIAVSDNGDATGTLYIDDGKSYDYRNEKKYLYLRISLYQEALTIRKIDQDAHFETEAKVGRILIAGLNKVPEQVTLETVSGSKISLEIFNITSNFFEIKTNDLSLTDQWTIMLSGAKQNILCAAMAIAILLLHAIKLF